MASASITTPAVSADAPTQVVGVDAIPDDQMGLDIGPETVAAYAEAVARAWPDTPVAATFLSLRRPDALKRTAWVGEATVLDAAFHRTKVSDTFVR